MMLNFNDFSFDLSYMKTLSPDKILEQTKVESLSRNTKNHKPNILIFSDNDDIRFLLKFVLEVWNCEASEASTVEQAIYTAERKFFDFVLMDTKLEFSYSLSEMQEMQKSDCLKSSPFLILSGHAQNDVRLSAFAAGAAEYFIKPINLDLLEYTLKTHIANGKNQKVTKNFL